MHYPFLLGAARVLSGVSPNRFVLSQANRTAPNQKPRLAEVLSLTLTVSPLHPEVSLVFWTGVFLSPGRRIRVTGKETGPGPGGYG